MRFVSSVTLTCFEIGIYAGVSSLINLKSICATILSWSSLLYVLVAWTINYRLMLSTFGNKIPQNWKKDSNWKFEPKFLKFAKGIALFVGLLCQNFLATQISNFLLSTSIKMLHIASEKKANCMVVDGRFCSSCCGLHSLNFPGGIRVGHSFLNGSVGCLLAICY